MFDLKRGITTKREMIVTANDTASRYGSGLIDVFATPAMIGLMEGTAQHCAGTYLPEGITTLGIEVNIRHIKATPVGMKVRCEAVLIEIDGKKLLFEVNAWDEQGQIGTGTHTRFIIETSKFIEKLNAASNDK